MSSGKTGVPSRDSGKSFSNTSLTLVLECILLTPRAYEWGIGGGTFFKVGGKIDIQKIKKNLWFELATVTPQALEYDVINFCQHV